MPLEVKVHIIPHLIAIYSCLPNSRAGLIKRAGWNSTEKKLSEQGLLSEQGGRF